jgi:hypothetical protein
LIVVEIQFIAEMESIKRTRTATSRSPADQGDAAKMASGVEMDSNNSGILTQSGIEVANSPSYLSKVGKPSLGGTSPKLASKMSSILPSVPQEHVPGKTECHQPEDEDCQPVSKRRNHFTRSKNQASEKMGKKGEKQCLVSCSLGILIAIAMRVQQCAAL